jgi:hypothetical protein
VLVGWAGYTAVQWVGYGRVGLDRRTDPLLERFMREYEVAERHETQVRAPAGVTFAAALSLRLEQSRLIRGIFRAREMLMRVSPKEGDAARLPLLEQMQRLGWGVLAEEPERILVMGAVTQPWKRDVSFHALPPAAFADFKTPGYVQILWTLETEPLTQSTCVFRTRTRVRTTDAGARRLFRRYWAFLSPGIRLIRLESLRIVKNQAQRWFEPEPKPSSRKPSAI